MQLGYLFSKPAPEETRTMIGYDKGHANFVLPVG
jgi:hypothetical protein